jgi:hypothetical protein
VASGFSRKVISRGRCQREFGAVLKGAAAQIGPAAR